MYDGSPWPWPAKPNGGDPIAIWTGDSDTASDNMPQFDYAKEAELFDVSVGADRSSIRMKSARRQPIGYKRFARSADAIRFAIEDLPAPLLVGICLEVGDVKYRGDEIRRLYESAGYPHSRRAAGRR